MVAWVAWERLGHLLVPREPERPRRRPVPAPSGEPDDLQAIKGIGPAYAGRLEEVGITSYAALAAAGKERVAEILGVSPERAAGMVREARRLAGQ